jgi:general secretion pathway protein L
MLAEFTEWWTTQMRSLLPGLPGAGRMTDALIVAIDRLDEEDAAVTISGALLHRRGGHEILAGTLDLDGPAPELAASRLAVGLRLPPEAVLVREVVLPLAAARDLQTVLGFEIDRLTPFSTSELYWGVSGLTPDKARGKLKLNLSCVLRTQVETLRQALGRIRLIPSFIDTGTGRIDLAMTSPGSRRTKYALSALCGILAVACVIVPSIQQQIGLDRSAATIAAAAPAARTAQTLRLNLAAAAAGGTAIAQAEHDGDALNVLATLTAALPDDTWLSDFTLKSGDLSFDGQSANAARLIGLLSAVPGLRDPSFTAPVTRSADGKADLFSIHATVSE